MAWSTKDLFSNITGGFKDFADSLWAEKVDSGISALLKPVAPYNSSPFLTPVVTLVGVVGICMLSGLAVASLAAMTAALLAIYFLLSEVFGYDIALAPLTGGPV